MALKLEGINMDIAVFRDLPEENWISMELYADRLLEGLRNNRSPLIKSVIEVSSHVAQPISSFLRKIGYNSPAVFKVFEIYLSRYLFYPLLSHSKQADINHIVDHSYGHLLQYVNRSKTIVTCHDLIPLRIGIRSRNKMHSRIAAALFRYSVKSMSKAARIIADSENTKKDICHYCNYDADKISVIPPGLNSGFKKIGDQSILNEVKRKYVIPNSIKMLHIGHCQPYKNVEAILHVLSDLIYKYRFDVCLLKVGGEFTVEQRKIIDGLHLSRNIVKLPFLPKQEVPLLYNLADVMILPSLYEGFGWPALEAMACGTPVVTSNRGSLPEVVGNAAIMVDPQDLDRLTEAVASVLTDNALREVMIAKGLEKARHFSWERNIEKTIEVYQEIYNRIRRR
jgi:glycosyltransferase involved in cell wall biosynthesis